jgi:hypothetical protein
VPIPDEGVTPYPLASSSEPLGAAHAVHFEVTDSSPLLDSVTVVLGDSPPAPVNVPASSSDVPGDTPIPATALPPSSVDAINAIEAAVQDLDSDNVAVPQVPATDSSL